MNNLFHQVLSLALILFTHSALPSPSIYTLDDSIKDALQNSKQLQSIKESHSAAEAAKDSVRYSRLPKISLDGSYRTQSIVPEMTVGLNRIKLSDTHSYSFGPSISWILFDGGYKGNTVEALNFLSEAKNKQIILSENQIKLATLLTYTLCSLAIDVLNSSIQAEDLAKTQYTDIKNKWQSGVASKLDYLSAENEISNFHLKAEQAMNDLQTLISDLNYLTGKELSSNNLQKLSLIFDSQNQSIKNLQLMPQKIQNHPAIQLQYELEKSSFAQADAQKSAYLPIVSLQLKSTYDYPNGPIFEQINQNSTAINFSWSVFEFGSSKKLSSSKLAEALSVRLNKENLIEELNRDFTKAKIKMKSLLSQKEEAEKILDKQIKISQLNFSSYKIGKLSYSEVQNSNIRQLEAQNRLSSINAQILIQLFNLNYLKEGESNEK